MQISGPVVRSLVVIALGAGLTVAPLGCSGDTKTVGNAAETDVKQQQKVQDSMKDFIAKKSSAGKK